jgi:predicted dienelactone hydrolase
MRRARITVRKSASILLAITLAAAAAACAKSGGPRLALPKPTGPFAVGTMWLSFTDPERPETFTADPADHREIAVRVWYPADIERSSRPCLYAEPGILLPEEGLPEEARAGLERLGKRLSSITTNSVKDARVAAKGGPFPVVVYSHGYWAGMNQSTVLMEELASHGYVAASIGHSFETNNVTRPDGRVVRFDPRNPEFMLRGRERQAALSFERAIVDTTDPEKIDTLFREIMKARPKTLESLAIWTADISFAVDRFEEMNRDDERFRGQLDLGCVGVLGHSFGGAASGQAGLTDPRIGAGINMDGLQLGDMVDKDIRIPFMFVHHDNRPALNTTPNVNLFRRARGPAYLLVIKGTGHYNFSDFSLPLLSEGLPLPGGALGPIEGSRCVEILNGAVTRFFDVYLRGEERDELMKVFERYPEIETFRK